MFIVNVTITGDAAVDDDVTTSNSLVEYTEKKGYVDVTAEQLQEIEKKIVREVQQAAFAKDITELMALPQSKDEGVLRSKIFTSVQLRRKEVFLNNEGLLRTVTRLDNAAFVSPDEKRPLLLPSKHPLTQLLVREYHWQATHSGPKTTFVWLARRYSLPLSAVKNVTYKCQHCRERTPIPVKYPQAQCAGQVCRTTRKAEANPQRPRTDVLVRRQGSPRANKSPCREDLPRPAGRGGEEAVGHRVCLQHRLHAAPPWPLGADGEGVQADNRQGCRLRHQDDRASSAHTTPSASNARASTGRMASAGLCRGRPRGAKNRSWQGDPTRYKLRSSTMIDDND
jgi:hypothetical protein